MAGYVRIQDILAALRDPRMLCMDLMDRPDLIRRAGRHLSEGFVAAFKRSYAKLAAAGFGSTTWLPSCHEGPAYPPSCDFWCMVSPEIGREMILPDIFSGMPRIDDVERLIRGNTGVF